MTGRVIRPAEAAERLVPEGCHILELANDPHDPAVSIARARVRPGVTTRRHRLEGTIERYVILAGTGRVELDGRASDVQAGDVVLIPPRCVQSITNNGPEDLVFLAICTPRFEWNAYEDVEPPAAE